MIDKEKLDSAVTPKFSIEGFNAMIYDPTSVWDSIRDNNLEQPQQETQN